jgi:peptidoglycan/LPS O-acetylase OafA/YrhL
MGEPTRAHAAPSAATDRSAALSRLPSLTGLRWLAAFMVLGFHLNNQFPMRNAHLHFMPSTFAMGGVGVTFFFVLSGFVLVWSARPGDTKRRFWQRRFAKIYPNHLVALLLWVGFYLYWNIGFSPEVLLANLFLVNTWIFQPGYETAINAVSWTLGVEAFFYLCMPFLFPVIRRMSVQKLYVALMIVPLGILLTNLAFSLFLTDFHAFAGTFPPLRFLEFWTGMLIGELAVRGSWAGPGLWASTALTVATYLASFHVEAVSVRPLAFGALIAAAAAADVRGRWSPWRWRPLVWLGEVSYAFYLVHALFIALAIQVISHVDPGHRHWFGPQALLGPAGLFLVAVFGLSLLTAALMYYAVERPMMRILGPRRRPRPAAVPSQRDAAAGESSPATPVESEDGDASPVDAMTAARPGPNRR